MKKLFENWRKHLSEAEYVPGRAAGNLTIYEQPELINLICGKGYEPEIHGKCFAVEKYEKVFLGEEEAKTVFNIKLDKGILSYNTPDGKRTSVASRTHATTSDGRIVQLGVYDDTKDDDAFLAAINLWDEHFRAGGGSGEY
mgnify:CR=1 FL=1|tara:strand:- start:143 stop:565 length:423 start_codon:yes stop_codon:yes gene_type:complete